MPQGFGKPQPNKLVEQVVRHCQHRRPEQLDKIFDALPVGLTPTEHKRKSQEVLAATIAALQNDIDALAWLCGYFAGEINRTSDNESLSRITLLSKILIKSGMQPFADFVPYPGCRIVTVNAEKLATLPAKVQDLVHSAYDVTETSVKEAQRINDALLSELILTDTSVQE
jgi:hypothetical protein